MQQKDILVVQKLEIDRNTLQLLIALNVKADMNYMHGYYNIVDKDSQFMGFEDDRSRNHHLLIREKRP